MNEPKSSPNDGPAELSKELRRLTRRGFAWGGASAFACAAAWWWVRSRAEDGKTPWPLRRVLVFDEKVTSSAFDPSRLSREFPASEAKMPRLNGRYGVDENLNLAAWRLKIEGPSGSKVWSIANVKALPRFEVTTELRCIEGWSEVVTWGGARFSDLAAATGLARRSGKPGNPLTNPSDLLPYVSLTTPDSAYFVGLDIASALHPQTLLCYEMNGQPLPKHRGAPLRLAIPVKYGIKSLKQIGTIRFGEARPSDFWAIRGYDWFAGL